MPSILSIGELQHQIEELRAQSESLALRVRTLEDIEAIRALHARYHDYVDKGSGGKVLNSVGLREVFTDDVFFYWGAERDVLTQDQLEAGMIGHRGLENVIAMLEASTSVWEMAVHSMLNEEITVAGDTALGTRSDWVATRTTDGPNLWFLKGSSTYIRTPQGWRIQRVELHYAGKLLPEAHVSSRVETGLST
jgi:hypothetical protein